MPDKEQSPELTEFDWETLQLIAAGSFSEWSNERRSSLHRLLTLKLVYCAGSGRVDSTKTGDLLLAEHERAERVGTLTADLIKANAELGAATVELTVERDRLREEIIKIATWLYHRAYHDDPCADAFLGVHYKLKAILEPSGPTEAREGG